MASGVNVGSQKSSSSNKKLRDLFGTQSIPPQHIILVASHLVRTVFVVFCRKSRQRLNKHYADERTYSDALKKKEGGDFRDDIRKECDYSLL